MTTYPAGACTLSPRLSAGLDPVSLQFVSYACSQISEVIQIGCDNTMTVLAVVERGGKILVVDADPAVLTRLNDRTPREQRPRLRTQVGTLNQLEYPDSRFSGAHLAHCLERLSGPQIERALTKVCGWIHPGSKAFISTVMTSYCVHLLDADMLSRQLILAGFEIEEGGVRFTTRQSTSMHCALVVRRPECH